MSAVVLPFRKPRGAIYDDPSATWEAGSVAYQEATALGRPPLTRDAAAAGREACGRALRLFSWLVRYYAECEGPEAVENEGQCRRNVSALLTMHDSFRAALRVPCEVIPLPWVTLHAPAPPAPPAPSPKRSHDVGRCRHCSSLMVGAGWLRRHERFCVAGNPPAGAELVKRDDYAFVRCGCGKTYSDVRWFERHQAKCKAVRHG